MNDTTRLNPTKLESALRRHAVLSGKKLTDHHPHAVSYLAKKGITPGKIREHATKLLASGTVAASLVLASPALQHLPKKSDIQLTSLSSTDRQKQFATEVKALLPNNDWHLGEDTEQAIATLVSRYWGFDSTPQLTGHRLNTSYGLMGAEQHLPRYPGDSVYEHEDLHEAGITPATGAWSYFSNSKSTLTRENIEREKYYVAVQTLYLPDWNTNTKELKEWYKYRKVVVMNPVNGKVIICDVADAGPAQFTGKHFGGSPEVMHYLDLDRGMKKGPVILFFLDEHDQPVPLGPVEYNVKTGRPA